jgi:hypothetical protein
MSGLGLFRQIDPLPTLAACPLRSDRVRTFAPQRIDAVCQLADMKLPRVTDCPSQKTPRAFADAVMELIVD